MEKIKRYIVILWKRHHFIILPRYWKKYLVKVKNKFFRKRLYYHPFIIDDYNKWIRNNKKEIERNAFEYNPLISFIIPVYNIERKYLCECLDSILEQSYSNFEICLADDCSTKEETIETLKEYESKDKRIKVVYRKENGHISKSTNSALEIATGDYIALMDDDDTLDKDALYEVVKEINKDNKIDFIYTDEDKLDMEGNYCEPHFKSDFSVDSFLGGNFICHFTVIKKTIFDKIGGFDEEYVGAQDFDLFLRATEVAKNICHIPKILYHWRKIPGSTADNIGSKTYAIDNGKKAVEAALVRRNLDATVSVPINCTHYIVNYNITGEEVVTVIMMDTNKNSIINNINELNKNYKNLEFIINGKEIALDKKYNNVIFDDNNIDDLIKMAKGEYILFVSGNIKLLNKDIISSMIGYSKQGSIGVVGPKICDNNGIIKSAGLIISNKNIYVDAYKDYFLDSVGFYGRLLVPYTYKALSCKFFMFEKRKYIDNKMNDTFKNFDLLSLEICLNMDKVGYRNNLLSHLYVEQFDNNKIKIDRDIYDIEKNKLREKWNLDDDKYYNINLSKDYPFMLELGDRSDEKN